MKLEFASEMALVVKTGSQSNLCQRLVRVNQLADSVLQAAPANILADRAAEVLPKDFG